MLNHILLILAVLTATVYSQTVTVGGGNTSNNDFKANVRVASTADLDITGTDNQVEVGDTIDGVVLVAGDRVLIKNQASPEKNGIYKVSGESLAPVRTPDANSWVELAGCIVAVGNEGTVNKNKVYICATSLGGTLETDSISWTEKGATGAGTGDALVADPLSQFAATTSDQLRGVLNNETGTGLAVFATSPTLSTSLLTDSATFAFLNTTATTVNAFGATTALNIGSSAATVLNLGGHTSAAELRFLEPSGSGTNYFGLKAAAMAGSVSLTWPNDAPAAGEVLGDSDANGVLEWVTPGDVTAASAFAADNVIIRSDGTGKGVQPTGWSIANTDEMVATVDGSEEVGLFVTASGTDGIAIHGTNQTNAGIGVLGTSAVSGGAALVGIASHASAIPLKIRNSDGFYTSITSVATAAREWQHPDDTATPNLYASRAWVTGQLGAGVDFDSLTAAVEADLDTDDVIAVSVDGTEKKMTLDDLVDWIELQTFATINATTATVTTLSIGGTTVTATGTELNYVDGVTSAIQTQLDAKSPLASPTFTGTPAAPTAALGTNTTQVATTAFVQQERAIVTKNTAASYTIGTTDPRELYGGVIYVTGAATITVPAVAAGASFTVITIGAVAVSVDPNAADLIYLNGTALADGDKITNASTTGDMAVFTYYDSTGWVAQTNTGWTDGN